MVNFVMSLKQSELKNFGILIITQIKKKIKCFLQKFLYFNKYKRKKVKHFFYYYSSIS
jgi:hypothetical protein